MRMFWLNEKDSVGVLAENIKETNLKNCQAGIRASRGLYVLSDESAEVVIHELRNVGYTVKAITNHD